MGSHGLSAVAMLEAECAARFGRKHALALGRGTWALALLLRAIETKVRRKVLALPSFLCQTPLAGILYAGWQPLFVDVDPATGLVPDDEWDKAVGMGAGAAMLVHLFGNPAATRRAARLCREHGVFLIEDACQAVGAEQDGHPCGSAGDAALLSFGHTKTIDVGSGGMLLTDDAALVADVRALAARQTYVGAQRYDAISKEASRVFYERKDRLSAHAGDPAEVFSGAFDAWLALVPAPWTADAAAIARQLSLLPGMAAERRRKAALYASLLAGTPVVPLRLSSAAVPWRCCFRVPGLGRARQEEASTALRARGVHASNWYLPTHWMAPQPAPSTGALPGTLQLYAEIFQLWLDPATDDARIRANAGALREVLAA